MFQRTALGCMLALFCLTLTGCADTHESLVNEMVSTLDNALTDMENGVPEDKLKAKYESQFKSISERMKKLEKPTEEQAKRMMETMKTGMQKLQPRMQKIAEKTGKKMPGMPAMPGSPSGGF